MSPRAYQKPKHKVGDRVWCNVRKQYGAITSCSFPGYDTEGNPIDNETGQPRDASNDYEGDEAPPSDNLGDPLARLLSPPAAKEQLS